MKKTKKQDAHVKIGKMSIPRTAIDAVLGDNESLLTERKLDSILNVSRGKARVKSVSSPLAQTVIQCEGVTTPGWTYESLEEKYRHMKDYDEVVATVFDLQFAGACRISEVLSICASDIDSLGKVTIKSLKKGVTRIVQSSFSSQWLANCAQKGIQPFQHIDRFYVYRAYKKFGISEYYGDNQRASVTHLPRHEVALASKRINRSDETTKGQLGQKSVKSTAHYTEKKRGK